MLKSNITMNFGAVVEQHNNSVCVEFAPHVFNVINNCIFFNLSNNINEYFLTFEVECMDKKSIRIASLPNYCTTTTMEYILLDRVLQIEDQIYHHINEVALNNDNSIMTLHINTLQESVSVVIVTNGKQED